MEDFNVKSVSATRNGEHLYYVAIVNGKSLRSMSNGGFQTFHTALQAEVFGRNYLRGYTDGSYLSEDVDTDLSI